MKKRIVVFVLLGLVLVPFRPVEAQQPAKLRKIGFLNPTGGPMANVDAFREGMRQLGYVEGQNVEFEYKSVQQSAQLMDLANELVQRKVDMIVTAGQE